MKKCALSMLIAVSMTLTMLSVSVFASPVDSLDSEEPTTDSAMALSGKGAVDYELAASYTFDKINGILTINSDAGTTAWREDDSIPKTDVKRVTIANAVTTIGDSAFASCDRLTAVTIQNPVEEIKQMAFADCPNLYAVAISDNVRNVGNAAFQNCSSLVDLTI